MLKTLSPAKSPVQPLRVAIAPQLLSHHLWHLSWFCERFGVNYPGSTMETDFSEFWFLWSIASFCCKKCHKNQKLSREHILQKHKNQKIGSWMWHREPKDDVIQVNWALIFGKDIICITEMTFWKTKIVRQMWKTNLLLWPRENTDHWSINEMVCCNVTISGQLLLVLTLFTVWSWHSGTNWASTSFCLCLQFCQKLMMGKNLLHLNWCIHWRNFLLQHIHSKLALCLLNWETLWKLAQWMNNGFLHNCFCHPRSGLSQTWLCSEKNRFKDWDKRNSKLRNVPCFGCVFVGKSFIQPHCNLWCVVMIVL